MSRAGATITVVVAVGLAGGLATPAFAADPRSLAAVQATGTAETQARITVLNDTIPRVNSNAFLTSGDRAAILDTLNSDLSAMRSLQTKIAGDTDVATAQSDVQSIFTGYRVYAVAVPQALYAASADALTGTAIPALLTAQAALKAALAGPDKAKSTSEIEAQMADLAAQIATAQKSTAGLAAFALSVTPAQYNANHSILAAVRASVKTAGIAVQAASTDAKAVKAELR